MKILALDLGKFNSVACTYESPSDQHVFKQIRTTAQEIHDLVAAVEPDSVVFEVCSFAGWVHDLVRALDVEVRVANPAHEGWRWRSVKRKTDRDDALKLARLAAANQLPTVYMPSREVREWRSLIQYRHKLVGRRTAMRNNIRSMLMRQGSKAAPGHRAWTNAGLQELAKMACPLDGLGMDELWRGMLDIELRALQQLEHLLRETDAKLGALGGKQEQVVRVRTIPGVGPRLAEVIVAFIDDPHRFRNGRQVACYAGLTPKQYESGTMKRQGRISRHGPTLLRSLLVEVAWIVRRYNPWGQAVFDSIAKGHSSRRKQAVVALARRLLVRAWAIMRDGTTWRAPAPAVT